MKEIDHLEYSCRVTDYKLETKKDPSSKEEKPKVSESKEEKCMKYTTWLQVFKKTKKSTDLEPFFVHMESELEEFGTLTKLFRHAMSTHNEVQGKSRDLVKKRSAKLRKSISKDLHPDKIPHACKVDVEEMVRAIFDRATILKECIEKPSLCELEGGKETGGIFDDEKKANRKRNRRESHRTEL